MPSEVEKNSPSCSLDLTRGEITVRLSITDCILVEEVALAGATGHGATAHSATGQSAFVGRPNPSTGRPAVVERAPAMGRTAAEERAPAMGRTAVVERAPATGRTAAEERAPAMGRTAPKYPSPSAAAVAFEAAVARLRAEGFWEVPPPPSPHADIESWIREAPFDPAGYHLLADGMAEAKNPRGALALDYAKTLETRPTTPESPPSTPSFSAPNSLFSAPNSPPADSSSDPFFADLSTLSSDPTFGFSFSTRAGFVDEARVGDADPVVLADVVLPNVGTAVPTLPHTLAVHALRCLFAHPGARILRSLRIDIAERIAPFSEALQQFGQLAALTHLVVTSDELEPLSPTFPALISLACQARAVNTLLKHPVSSLSHLTVRHDKIPLDPLVDKLLTATPHLHHRGLWDFPLDAAGVKELATNGILPHLKTLDLWARLAPLPTFFAGVLACQAEFAHLAALILPRQSASAEVVHQLTAWPNIVWADGRRHGAETVDRTTFTALGLGELAL